MPCALPSGPHRPLMAFATWGCGFQRTESKFIGPVYREPVRTVRLGYSGVITRIGRSGGRFQPGKVAYEADEKKAKTSFRCEGFSVQGQWRKDKCDYGENGVIFSQGDPADAIFYIQKGKVKLTVLSKQGKKPSSPFWVLAISLAKGAWRVSRYAWEPPSACPGAQSCGWRRPK